MRFYCLLLVVSFSLLPGLASGQRGRRPAAADLSAADIADTATTADIRSDEDAPPLAAENGNGGSAALADYFKIAASFAAEADEEKDMIFHACQHVQGETLVQLLENFLTPAGTVAVSEEADLVVISDVKENLELLKRIAAEMDKPVKQVLVEARIVEFGIDTNFRKEVNLEFQKFANVVEIPNLPTDYMDYVSKLSDAFVDPGGNMLNTRGVLSYMGWEPERETLLSAFVQYLETKGKAKILTAPNLILRRGVEGNIITGEEVPILTQTTTGNSISTSTTFKSVGIKLRVKPVMIQGDRIRLDVSPEVSNVSRTDEATGAPIIAVRNAKTELELRDGQLVSIGGLLRNEELERERRVPVLSAIPLLGHLFRGTSQQTVQSQLVIFIRVTILADNIDQLPALRALELPESTTRELREAEMSLKGDDAESLGKDVKKFFNVEEEEKKDVLIHE
ncbi:MAG: type II and III secretion system protein [Lentisphaeria bacterium]|nr:type II and III secretion system protein [Lentisphaeria bacterium]